MRTTFRILRRDVGRLLRAPAAWVIVLGLTVLPAFYAWVNILGFWDPYGNTDGVRVSVANADRGADDALLGEVDLGARIVATLRGNHDIGWTFTDKDAAMRDVRSGRSYAAIVIPEDFSERLVALVHGDVEDGRPRLDYYVNEKTSPIAPKVTDTAATTVDRQVNAAFVDAAGEAVGQALGDVDAQATRFAEDARTRAVDAIDSAQDGIARARRGIADLAADDHADTIRRARDALQTASRLGGDASAGLDAASGLVTSTRTALDGVTGAASGAFDQGSSLLAQATGKATGTMSAIAAAALKADGRVDGALAALRDVNDRNAALIADLDALAAASDDPAFVQAVGDLRRQNTALGDTITDLATLADGVATTADDAATLSDDLGASVGTTLQSAADARAALSSDTLPKLDGGLDSLASAAGTLGGRLAGQDALISQALLAVDQFERVSDQASAALSSTDEALAGVQTRLGTLRTDLDTLSSAGALSSLPGVQTADGGDAASLLRTPAVLDTTVIYPVGSYGSGMAPLFTNLAMWAGAFMLVALIRLETDDEGIGDMTDAQAYMGRWLLLAALAAMQGLVVTVGDLIIGVQTVAPALFVCTGVIAALVYSAVAYALATTFQHVGKALVMALIIVQIPGAGGMYPIEMMPGFFRALHPFFPFTYTIDAMRETIAGFYGGVWASCIVRLLLFAAAAFAVGLAVRPRLSNVNRLFARLVAETEILNGEPEPPARRGREYRIAQVLHALGDHDGYRAMAAERAARFTELYPRLRRGALIAGLIVPVVLAVTFSLTTDAKLVMLGAWTVWVLLVIAFLLGVELVRDGLRRQVELGELDDEEIRVRLALRGLDRTAARRRRERLRARRRAARGSDDRRREQPRHEGRHRS